MALSVGSEVLLKIERPVAGGRMLARHDGQVVLVAGAIPGEEVEARIERVASGLAHATVTRVIAAGPDRRPAIDPGCGGNAYAHIAYARQLQLKSDVIADAFRRIAKLPLAEPVSVTGSPERGYRMRARLHVRGSRIGFFREGTHDLCDPATTGQLLDSTVESLSGLSAALEQSGVRDVVALELTENVAGDQRAIQLELNAASLAPAAYAERAAARRERRGPQRAACARWGARAGVRPRERWIKTGPTSDIARALVALEGVTGLTCVSPGRPPLIVGGTPYVADPISALVPEPMAAGAAVLRRHPAAFFQGNRYLLAALVQAVLSRIERGPVLDLYAGVGLFAVTLAASGRGPVTAVEGDRACAADLRENAQHVDVRPIESAVETFLRQASGDRAAVVVVDPPRTGLSGEVAKQLVGYGAPRLVYVSCDVATLARDVRRLVDGGYTVTALDAFDLFPNTAHVETVATLTKAG